MDSSLGAFFPAALLPLADEVAAFLLGAHCAGCGLPGTLLCGVCGAAVSVAVPQRFRTAGGLLGVAALRYEGPAALCIRAIKEQGSTRLARPLGRSLSVALALALAEAPPGAVLVPVPTSRAAFRRRGFRVPDMLVRRAGEKVRRGVLLPARAVRDQRALGRAERGENVRGSMRVRRSVVPVTAILVDDVVTTGATLDEAALTLRAAGFAVFCAVALAATPR